MPISRLYASVANSSRDLFCAFHPQRVMVPSFALRLESELKLSLNGPRCNEMGSRKAREKIVQGDFVSEVH